jgi:hypothetical protein
MQSGPRRVKPRTGMNEQLKHKRRPRSPNGRPRETTIQPPRNLLTIDMGDDIWGIRKRLDEKAKVEGRTISSIVREILKHTLIDWAGP